MGNPISGFTTLDEGFAGIIHARPVGGGAEIASTASTSSPLRTSATDTP